VDRLIPEVGALLHEERPVRLGQVEEVVGRERAVPELPRVRASFLQDEPALDAVLAGQAGQLLRRERGAKVRQRVANEKGLRLPVRVEEGGRRAVAEDLRGRCRRLHKGVFCRERNQIA